MIQHTAVGLRERRQGHIKHGRTSMISRGRASEMRVRLRVETRYLPSSVNCSRVVDSHPDEQLAPAGGRPDNGVKKCVSWTGQSARGSEIDLVGRSNCHL